MSIEDTRIETCIVGAGPSGLSLAAHLDIAGRRSWVVVDAAEGPGWHNSLLFPDASLQTSWRRDLVPDFPSSPYSFHSFLSAFRLSASFTLAQHDEPPRWLFREYLVHVASLLRHKIRWNFPVLQVTAQAGQCTAVGRDQEMLTRHCVLATGTRALRPIWAEALGGWCK